jgi:hypothetical protein
MRCGGVHVANSRATGLVQLLRLFVTVGCNGAECWKSYKSSRAAIAAGFAKVYWYRGGMPDWESTGQTIAKE